MAQDTVVLYDGRVLRVHGAGECIDDVACCIHSPSDHPLRSAPMAWVDDARLIMRICPHGQAHPDPDDLYLKPAFMGLLEGLTLMEAVSSVHIDVCDGCCQPVIRHP